MSTLNEFISQADWPVSTLVTDAGWLFDPDIVDGLPVWEWKDSTDVYTTRVYLDPENRRQVRWEIWNGAYQVGGKLLEAYGVKAALHLIASWRIVGRDELEVRMAAAMDARIAEEALYPGPCRTCPNCGCPGSY